MINKIVAEEKVALIMGSDSDYPVLESCITTLKDFGVDVHVEVCSAHRTPDRAAEFAKTARENRFGVIITAAGMAAHLGGVIAAHTTLPVVGIPVKAAVLDGMDALLSTVMMPPGVPVASVGINAATNAALFAIQILAVKNDDLSDKLADYKLKMAQKIEAKNQALNEKIKNELC